MKQKERYYIAYGSNLNLEQMNWRCPGAIPVQVSWLNGWRLMFKGSKSGNYLTIEKAGRDEDSRVPIVIYKITPEDEEELDRYEGFPTFYYKRNFQFLKKINGQSKPFTAFAYIMHEDRKCGVPSMRYMETCREGYADFGLDEKYLWDAFNYSISQVKKAGTSGKDGKAG